jgi:hypothetical protein
MTPCRLRLAVAISLLSLADSGCQRRPTVTVQGAVSWQGQPVQFGTIAFQPETSEPSVAGEIRDGRYVVKGVRMGNNKVRISAFRSLQGSSPESLIPANATGNDQVVEVKEPASTLDFSLRPR